MRWPAIASVMPTMVLTAIIAVLPVGRAVAQGKGATSPDFPDAGAPAAVPGAAAAAAGGDGGIDSSVGESAPPVAPAADAPVAPTMAPARRVEVAEAPPPPPPPRRMVASLSHDLQFGLALLLGDGYRGIFPYATMIDCGDAKTTENRVCTNRAPVFLDVQPSFGLSDRWNFLVDLRFGLTKDFNTYHQFYAMPGFRYWLDPQSQVKFFTTIQLAYDRSRQNNQPGAAHTVSDDDLGFRNSNGLMVEVMRNFGVYAQFGETVGFYRWLSFTVDAGIGVQARVP